MKEDQSNKKKGWFDFLRPSRSSLSRSEFNALFDQRNYYSRELEDIAKHGAKSLVDEWALETSKKASRQLQSNVSLPDFRFLPDVQWNNGVFTYNVNSKEVTDDKETQVSRLKELSDHYGYSLPNKAEDVVRRDRFKDILNHYYKDDQGIIYKPEISGDLRLDLNILHLLPEESKKAYSNITMEDFSKVKLSSLSIEEVNDFKERSQKAVEGSKLLNQVFDDIKATRLFNKNIPDSVGLSFNTNGSPLSFPVDSYHATDNTLTLFSHKAMQNGEPVHLNIDKDVVRRLEKLSEGQDQQFIMRKDKDTVEVNYHALPIEKEPLSYEDAGEFQRELDSFIINGNRNVELKGTLEEDENVELFSNYLQDASFYGKVYASPEQRQLLLDALKAKEKELLDLPEKIQKGSEIFEALNYKSLHDMYIKGSIPNPVIDLCCRLL